MKWQWIAWTLFVGTPSLAQSPPTFEDAIKCIKRFEGWHTAQHHPYIGYGHRLRPEEQLKPPLTEVQADSLLRSDLRKMCAVFRRFNQDSLLLATLSYNVGPYALLGHGKRPKSHLIRKLEAGDRNIRQEYLSFRMYRGKVLRSLEERRKCEFELLFIPIYKNDNETKCIHPYNAFPGFAPYRIGEPCRKTWLDSRRPYLIRPPDERVYGAFGRNLRE